MRQRVGVFAAFLRRLALLRVAQVGEVGVVELHVGASGGAKRSQFLAVTRREVLEEPFHVRIGVLADRAAPAAEMHHGRRRDANLRRAALHLRFQVREVLDLDRLHVLQLAAHFEPRRREIDFALGGMELGADAAVHRDAFELLEEVDVEIGAAVLAVGDRAQADVLLKLHRFRDGAILDRAQRGGVDLAAGLALARIEQVFRDAAGCRRGRRGTAGGFSVSWR